jgi:DNA-directed RNA polymerase subunit RPC12/RpoP
MSASESSTIIICGRCGHQWSRRKNRVAQKRQCPKCYSRRTSEKNETEGVTRASTDIAEPGGTQSTIPSLNVSTSGGGFPPLSDDADVRRKLKELELVRIEREIRDLKGQTQDPTVFERFLVTHWILLDRLHAERVISDSDHDFLKGECPWCGAERKEGIMYSEFVEKNGVTKQMFRCMTCGHTVTI